MFHVPEYARDRTHPRLGSDASYGNNGAFFLESPEPGWRLMLICSDGEGWEHVSVHAFRGRLERTPKWIEMVFVKSLCWDDDDVVIQFHPRAAEYVNDHPHTLHLWRPIHAVIPTPDRVLV
jgi:hypothetical protein